MLLVNYSKKLNASAVYDLLKYFPWLTYADQNWEVISYTFKNNYIFIVIQNATKHKQVKL